MTATRRPLHPPVVVLLLAVMLLVVGGGEVWANQPAVAIQGPGSSDADEGSEAGWRDILWRARVAASEHAYEARLIVVSLDEEAPAIGQLEVAQNNEGSLVTGPSRSWVLGRVDGRAFFGDEQNGRLLRLGGSGSMGMSPARIEDNYDVRVERGREVLSRPTVALEFVDEGSRHTRERLFVDQRSGLVLRRETFDVGGRPTRLVTLTRLSLTPVELPSTGSQLGEHVDGRWDSEVEAAHTEMSRRSRDILREIGWVVPGRLHAGFEIVDAAAIAPGEIETGAPVAGTDDRPPTDDDEALHLVYSDGLYRLSIYEQFGRLEGGALRQRGAVPRRLGDRQVYRWASSEPSTYVWSGDGYTFTVVSDAPPGVIAEAVTALPHDPAPSLTQRVGNGLDRFARWLWPFG